MPTPRPQPSSVWLVFAVLIAGCARDPMSSLDSVSTPVRASSPGATLESSAQGAPVHAGARLPDFTVGMVWTYDVTVRSRSRPQDGSEPWTAWTTRRIVREARAVEDSLLDGRMYVVIQEFDDPVDPPGRSRVGFRVPHRRDAAGLYHRPPALVIGSLAAGSDAPELVRRGGPVGEDGVLVPDPARPGATFVSDRRLQLRWIVQRHEPVPTGMGVVAAARVRLVEGFELRAGDEIVAWYAPTGRIASDRNQVRVALDAQHRPLWVEIDTRETLRSIREP